MSREDAPTACSELAWAAAGEAHTLPRLGFLGVGWIGANRMRALVESGLAEAVAVADPDPESREAAVALAPGATAHSGLEQLLELELDGVVIATPSALHADQAIAALERGLGVFCQKPLARTAAEARRVLDAARRAGRPFGVDLSYRHTAAATALREALAGDELGTVHAVELVFHNAYGPDKPWFTDRRLSGGGCVIDLGTHLLDLLLWLLGDPGASVQRAVLRRHGRPLAVGSDEVEDFAWVELVTDGGVCVRLACSWFLPAGRDCEFACTVYGVDAALSMHNVNGSFYDFGLEHRRGTAARTLVEPGDAWGGRALEAWVAELAAGMRFDADEGARLEVLARLIDEIYERGAACAP